MMEDYDYDPVKEAMIKHNVPVYSGRTCEECEECCLCDNGKLYCARHGFYTDSDYYC